MVTGALEVGTVGQFNWLQWHWGSNCSAVGYRDIGGGNCGPGASRAGTVFQLVTEALGAGIVVHLVTGALEAGTVVQLVTEALVAGTVTQLVTGQLRTGTVVQLVRVALGRALWSIWLLWSQNVQSFSS